jgi:Uma2 family endonuclease
MVAALKLPARHMTVAEFLDWDPEDGTGALWQLRDGRPEKMAPATDRNGSIHGELVSLLINALVQQASRCRVVIAPGVIPRVRADRNMLIPDIGITCDPPSERRALPNPVALVEILSPSNEAETRANLWAYATIPSVAEIVVLATSRIAAEVLRRGPDGAWPEQPELLGPHDELRLDSIGFAAPLKAAYRTSGIA